MAKVMRNFPEIGIVSSDSFFQLFFQMCKHNYITLFYNWSDYCSHTPVTHKGPLLYVEEVILFVYQKSSEDFSGDL